MFAMPQHQFAYAAPPTAPPTRQYATHGTSSAFSPSANPDEDWTKISDLAERRRIQNRIAQRNYRKKLKRRLEDLERRAGNGESDKSSAAAATPASSKTTTATTTKRQSTASKVQRTSPMPPKAVAPQFTPPMAPYDEPLYAPQYDPRDRSVTPPMFTYSTYPPPDEVLLPPYSAAQPYPATMADGYPAYLTPVPVTLPSMTHFTDAIKPTDDGLSPYMSYGFIHSMDVGAHGYDHSNPHTPPLSHSFDHSANCSDAGYEYPTTPLSMPGSPGMGHV